MTPAELRQVREHLGLTLNQLAASLGVDRSTVWRRETGRSPIGRETVIAVRELEAAALREHATRD